MYEKIKPLLFKMQAESAHELVHAGLELAQIIPGGTGFLNSLYSFPSSRLSQQVLGIDFPNPIGLAAGFDKNARVVDGMAALGFGFLELGSVTNKPCAGNDRPRLFRLTEDEALINRLGLNNTGPYRFLENLSKAKAGIPKLVSISKTNDPSLTGGEAIKDFSDCYRTVGSLAQAVVFNLSCPNTKDGKTFEEVDALKSLLDSLSQVRLEESFSHPVLVKFSSDVDTDALRGFLDVAFERGVNGVVLCNTSSSRECLKEEKANLESIGRGGLSGRPIFERSLERIRVAYQHLHGKLPIIGVGGVSSGEDAIKMIKSGASLVEIYTSLVYKGPALVRDILENIEGELRNSNTISISSLVGSDMKFSS